MLASRARDGTYVSHGADGTFRGHDDVSRRGAVPRGERVDDRDGPRAAEAAGTPRAR
jgi:hypothetical protein